MTAARAVPVQDPNDTPYERLKTRFRSMFWASMLLGTGIHFVAFAYSPQFSTPDITFTHDELRAIELPPEVEIPPPPRTLVRPAAPVVSSMSDFDQTVTIAPTTFARNPVEVLPLPEPREIAEETALEDRPTFTPFTVSPEILNREEVRRAMVNGYPPRLRAAGIGGVVTVYFFIDQEGLVKDRRIHRTSGFETLDDAALAVADVYRFSPALNRDKRVPVWVLIPIEFSVR